MVTQEIEKLRKSAGIFGHIIFLSFPSLQQKKNEPYRQRRLLTQLLDGTLFLRLDRLDGNIQLFGYLIIVFAVHRHQEDFTTLRR